MTHSCQQHCPIAVALDVDLAVDELVAARRGERLRLPSCGASLRFARLFQFQMLNAVDLEVAP